MKVLVIVVAATLATFGVWSPVFGQSLSVDTQRAIDGAMQDSIDTGWVAGGAVAVMRGGQVVFSKGYGMANLETGTSARPETVFRIGSVTKQFTAAAMLLLEQDGSLSLDDTVAKHLPRFDQTDRTTIRQLLNHTAGLADYTQKSGFRDREAWLALTTDQLVDYALAVDPRHDFEPGTRWGYSNTNYVLVGAIIERVSGKPLSIFLKERIFDPLTMTHTALDDAREIVPDRAMGYDRAAVDVPGYVNARTVSMTVPFAAGAMRSTAGDLLIWGSRVDARTGAFRRKLPTNDRACPPARLSDGSAAFVLAPDGTRYPVSYGLGITVLSGDGPSRIGHDGAIDGFTAVLTTYLDQDVTLAAVVNTSPSDKLPFDKIISAIESEIMNHPQAEE